MGCVSLPENLSNPDNISLEGLEELLNQIFEAPVSQFASDEGDIQLPPGSVKASDNFRVATTDGESRTICHFTKQVQPRLHSLHRRKKQVNETEVLGVKLKLFRARLQFALEELERTRLAEQELRIRLADAEDRLHYFELICDEAETDQVTST
jgi:hypothetical protein